MAADTTKKTRQARQAPSMAAATQGDPAQPAAPAGSSLASSGIFLESLLSRVVVVDGDLRREALRLLLDHINNPGEGLAVLRDEWRALAGENAADEADALSFPLVIDDMPLRLEADRDQPDLWLLRAPSAAEGGPVVIEAKDPTAQRRGGRKAGGPGSRPVPEQRLTTSAGELRPIVAAEPGIVGEAASAVLNRLVADSVLAEWIDALSRRLHTNAAALLIGLDRIADTLPAGIDDPVTGLTEAEEAALRAAGSLREPMPEPADRASVRTAVKYAAMQSSALTVAQAAKQLGVTDGRVRQRLSARTLYGVHVDGAWRLPQWQFGSDGKLIRGLDKVLPRLPEGMHPIAVQTWLTTAKSDLDLDGDALSPLQWLAGAGEVEDVTALIADLEWMP